MSDSREQRAIRVMSGEDRGLAASLLRGGLGVAEPFYAGAMRLRNALYDAGIFRSHRLSRPTISVGNLTTGGTGKTPVVRWLAEQLGARGTRPAILTRGYRGEATVGGSDEARMLAEQLGDAATVVANPDRVAGAMTAMSDARQPDVFLLDDGFQHRRVKRDFDLVLVNAAEPFGFGHVLPRGLLREPVIGLRRADAIVITRAGAVGPDVIEKLKQQLRSRNHAAPIYLADHAHASLRAADGTSEPIQILQERRFFAFSGIGNPSSLRRQFEIHGPTFAGFRAFGDHHVYSEADLRAVSAEASAAGAMLLVTTEKDWVKVSSLIKGCEGILPVARVELQIRFRNNDSEALLARVLERISSPAAAPATAAMRSSSAAGSAASADRAP